MSELDLRRLEIIKLISFLFGNFQRVKDISKKFYCYFMERRSMPVCFTEKQYKMIEEYAKRNGMLNASQALEKILSE